VSTSLPPINAVCAEYSRFVINSSKRSRILTSIFFLTNFVEKNYRLFFLPGKMFFYSVNSIYFAIKFEKFGQFFLFHKFEIRP
jgi:hypothetical protein